MSHYKPNPDKNVNLVIDGKPVTVPEGTTILEAARKINIHIPTLCDHPDLRRRSVCRLCVVECDGRGKLVAACANDVWEGVSIVTTNARIVGIRRTIVELLLANHPPECLSCIRNTKCELQTLAENFGIRSVPFRRDPADSRLPETSAGFLVRDMRKCVKCGRCVEVCQEVQTVRAINSSHRSVKFEICTPYEQALSEGPCIFCGQCAEVCPVGAIFEHDQTAEVWAALNSGGQHTAVQIPATAAEALGGELAYPPGIVTGGKMAAALKRMGFDKVFNAAAFADFTIREECKELTDRIKDKARLQGNLQGKLPMIVACSPGWIKFVKEFYPDLMDHVSVSKNPDQAFGSFVKEKYPETTTVSVMPCLATKHRSRRSEAEKNGCPGVDLVLTVRELARMIRLAGIDFTNLPESPFDETGLPIDQAGIPGNNIEAILCKVYEAYRGGTDTPVGFKDGNEGISEAELDLEGNKIKALLVDGLENARKVMDSIRRGECGAAFVAVRSCPIGCSVNGAAGPW